TAALEVSYRELRADRQRAFAVLGLHPGVEFEPYALAALLDVSYDTARRLLEGLAQVNLLDPAAEGRYLFHDLLHAFAAACGSAAPERRAALDRLYDFYAHTASRAMDAAYPYERAYRPKPPAPASPTPELADQRAAAAWLDAECVNLLAAAHHAAIS